MDRAPLPPQPNLSSSANSAPLGERAWPLLLPAKERIEPEGGYWLRSSFETVASRTANDGASPPARRRLVAGGDSCGYGGGAADLGRNPSFAPQTSSRLLHFL